MPDQLFLPLAETFTNREYATRIDVDIDSDGTITVSDNGRGIPAVEIDTPDGKEYQMVSAFTRARAGSNFDDTNRESIGMNGVSTPSLPQGSEPGSRSA